MTSGRTGRAALWISAVAAALAVIPATTANAATISAAEECCSFVGSPFPQAAGVKAELSNPGSPNTVPHNVYADTKGADGGPLFYSSLAGPGATVPVEGTEFLTPGSYRFRCTLHRGMNGVLAVSSGAAVPRPKVRPTIRSNSLSVVRRKGRIDLALQSGTSTGPVTVTVTANGSSAASAKVSSLRAGEVRRLSAKLSPKGRKTIARGSSVQIKVRAVAEFGSVGSASKNLRAGR